MFATKMIVNNYGACCCSQYMLESIGESASAYLKTWRLKFSKAKPVTAVFHLHNQEAKRELKFYSSGKLLSFCPVPTYFGVKLDRSLTFHHLETLRKKLPTSVTLLKRLSGSEWGAGAKILCTTAYSWLTPQLSTVRQFVVAAHTPVSSTVF